MTKLNLGCGEDYKPKPWVNVDHDKRDTPPEGCKFLAYNLEEIPWTFAEDLTVEHILLDNVLEHTSNPRDWVEEAHRVLETGGLLEVIVPHYLHPDAHVADHRSTFSPRWFHRYIDQYRYFDLVHKKVNYSGLWGYHQRKYLGRELLKKDPHNIHWTLKKIERP